MTRWICLTTASIFLTSAPSLTSAQMLQSESMFPKYVINTGDELEITVWGEERLKSNVRVLPDGTISFPLVGQIKASGKLSTEIEQTITAGLRAQFRGSVPNVTVMVKSPLGFQFSVIGKVRNPGTFTPGRYVNALEAIGMAGGPTEFAQMRNIQIVRKVGANLRKIAIRVDQVLLGRAGIIAPSDIPSMNSGDTLVVP